MEKRRTLRSYISKIDRGDNKPSMSSDALTVLDNVGMWIIEKISLIAEGTSDVHGYRTIRENSILSGLEYLFEELTDSLTTEIYWFTLDRYFETLNTKKDGPRESLQTTLDISISPARVQNLMANILGEYNENGELLELSKRVQRRAAVFFASFLSVFFGIVIHDIVTNKMGNSKIINKASVVRALEEYPLIPTVLYTV